MGKIIKTGFDFMAYANAGLIRKIDDIPELKNQLITLSESKTHIEMSNYALLLADHILAISETERFPLVDACFEIIAKWQAKQNRFQDALEIAGQFNDLARTEKNQVKAKVLRAMGQVAATPHVRFHPLVASEYAIVIMNLMYPKNFDKVRLERERQIELIKSISFTDN